MVPGASEKHSRPRSLCFCLRHRDNGGSNRTVVCHSPMDQPRAGMTCRSPVSGSRRAGKCPHSYSNVTGSHSLRKLKGGVCPAKTREFGRRTGDRHRGTTSRLTQWGLAHGLGGHPAPAAMSRDRPPTAPVPRRLGYSEHPVLPDLSKAGQHVLMCLAAISSPNPCSLIKLVYGKAARHADSMYS